MEATTKLTKKVNIQDYSIDYENVLGGGRAGDIFPAEYQGQAYVIIRKICNNEQEEVEILNYIQKLEELSTKKLINYFGYDVQFKKEPVKIYLIVLDGAITLQNFLQRHPDYFKPIENIIGFIEQILQVCCYFNNVKEIISRNLKIENIFVIEIYQDNQFKIVDLALGNFITDKNELIKNIEGNIYMAPELKGKKTINDKMNLQKIDVYGLGIVLIILAGIDIQKIIECKSSSSSSLEELVKQIDENYKDLKIGNIIRLFIQPESNRRPDFMEIQHFLIKSGKMNTINLTILFDVYVQNLPKAMNYIGNLYKLGSEGFVRDLKKAYEWFAKAADQNYGPSLTNIGWMHEKGLGVERDLHEAIECYLKAAAQGEPIAQFNLGLLYSKGIGVEKSFKKAAQWYSKAALQGHIKAICNLGICYLQGLGVEKSYRKARGLFLIASEKGDIHASYNLGLIYYHGWEVKKDVKKAWEWFSKSASKGHSMSQNNLAIILFQDIEIKCETEKAIDYLYQSVKQAYSKGQYNLGLCYKYGHGVKQNYQRAYELFAKAAFQGILGAQFQVALLLEEGLGTEQNIEEAIRWYMKAAERGNVESYLNLGLLYIKGIGVKKDKEKALEYYHKAAELDDPDAQYNLGVLWESGAFGEKSIDRANEWYFKSANNGCIKAQEKVGYIALSYKDANNSDANFIDKHQYLFDE